MQRFFVSGYPKSGTTYLQMLLDSHPDINCPSEQNLSYLFQNLFKLSRNYRKVIGDMDRKTGGQGVRFAGQDFFASMMRGAVVNLMEQGASKGTTHFGLNDNQMPTHGDLVARLMPRTRFVFIVRDPRETAVSLWHHKMRTEPRYAERASPMESAFDILVRTWPKYMRNTAALMEAWPKRCHVVRYEDLRGARRDAALRRLLQFIEAPAGPKVLEAMWQATDFDAMRSREQDKAGAKAGFFRAGQTDSWRTEAPPESVAKLVEAAGKEMRALGYDPEA